MVNKNKFNSTALASILLVLFLILAPSTVSASLIQDIEIRGPVYNGSDIDDIIDTYGDGTTVTIDATQFAAFYYDIDENVKTESLSIRDVYGTSGNVIGEGGVVYQTTIQATNCRFPDWGMYPVIGFFGKKYIPLNPSRADKFCKLVLDSDDMYTIRTGEILDLGEGYAIEVKQIDVNGSKVWLEFTRDGEYMDDEIVSVVDNGASTWDVELDGIQGEDDVVVLRVHVGQVFQGEVDSIVQIEGLWLIDYANATTIESDDEFGNLNDVFLNGDTLAICNENIFTLTRGNEVEIGQGMYFKVADTPANELRYYPFVTRVIGEHNTIILPVANFNSNVTSGNVPLAVQFTDTSQYATGISWDFNNDGLTDDSSGNVVYVYTASGQHKVNLTASNANGTNSKSMTITVYTPSQPVLPIANFTANTTQGYAPLAVQFTDSSQNAASWSWDFDGDGISDSNLQNPAHVYETPDIYTVNLSAGNQNGTASKTAIITVLEKEDENETDILPVANFSSNVV